MLNGKTILITGGTGSFGNHFAEYALKRYQPRKLIIYSRGEYGIRICADNPYFILPPLPQILFKLSLPRVMKKKLLGNAGVRAEAAEALGGGVLFRHAGI